jgi:hypothetical protein
MLLVTQNFEEKTVREKLDGIISIDDDGFIAFTVNPTKDQIEMFWLKDKSLADLDNLPDPDVLAQEIVENLEAGLASFRRIVEGLNPNNQ